MAINYLIDTDLGVIVDVEASRAIRQAEGRNRKPGLLGEDVQAYRVPPGTNIQHQAVGYAKIAIEDRCCI
jgi:hypothetical protein